ncbi:MAG: glycosyltransferase family 2 protein, partial [Aggregatilineales bacterium]
MTTPVIVSVVLPVYNGERYLALSIDSVLAQTFEAWELIIVDDCSTDKTPQIAQGYTARDPRIRYIRHEHNKKLPGALNTGFNGAQGRYHTWTSDDNIYRPHALTTMVDFLQSHSGIDLVYTDYSFIDENGDISGFSPVADKALLVKKAVVGTCFMYKREIHEKLNGYDENLFTIEDYDFWLRASMYFELAPLHEDLYLYRQHPGTLTSTRRQQILTLRQASLEKYLPAIKWLTDIDRARGYLHLMEIAEELEQPDKIKAHRQKALSYDSFAVLRYY